MKEAQGSEKKGNLDTIDEEMKEMAEDEADARKDDDSEEKAGRPPLCHSQPDPGTSFAPTASEQPPAPSATHAPQPSPTVTLPPPSPNDSPFPAEQPREGTYVSGPNTGACDPPMAPEPDSHRVTQPSP